MRMRRKKHLEERLENCGEKLICVYSEDRNFLTAANDKEYLDFTELFGNNHPVHMEIGCGKGQFAREIARQNPQINFLAVEKCSNVIVPACEKAIEEHIPNLIFLKCGAEYLPKFIPEQSVERLYLNFSCPYPKNKYANHRLTNKRFLAVYKHFLRAGAEIHQKTDNMHFFEYSIEQFSDFGYTIKNISLDLHNSNYEGNIVTEYEKRFSDLGQPIYRLEAYMK